MRKVIVRGIAVLLAAAALGMACLSGCAYDRQPRITSDFQVSTLNDRAAAPIDESV